MFSSFFSGLFDWIILILKLMTSQGVEGSWIDMEGGEGGTGGLGGNVETPLNLIYCHQFFLLFFIKMCWRTLKRDSLQSYFLHLQHQTLAPSFAIVQTGSGLGQKILDIFVLETARVNGTYISESLRPTVTKKISFLWRSNFYVFSHASNPKKVRLTKHSSVKAFLVFNPPAFMLFSLKVCAVQLAAGKLHMLAKAFKTSI